VDFVEICNVCTRKVIIKDAKRIFNSDKICHSYCDFYFGVTFLEHTVFIPQFSNFTQVKCTFTQPCLLNFLCKYVHFPKRYRRKQKGLFSLKHDVDL